MLPSPAMVTRRVIGSPTVVVTLFTAESMVNLPTAPVNAGGSFKGRGRMSRSTWLDCVAWRLGPKRDIVPRPMVTSPDRIENRIVSVSDTR